MRKKVTVVLSILISLFLCLQTYNYFRSLSFAEKLIPLIANNNLTKEKTNQLSIVHLGNNTNSSLTELSPKFTNQTQIKVTFYEYFSNETNSIVFYNNNTPIIGIRLKHNPFSSKIHIIGNWTTGLEI